MNKYYKELLDIEKSTGMDIEMNLLINEYEYFVDFKLEKTLLDLDAEVIYTIDNVTRVIDIDIHDLIEPNCDVRTIKNIFEPNRIKSDNINKIQERVLVKTLEEIKKIGGEDEV